MVTPFPPLVLHFLIEPGDRKIIDAFIEHLRAEGYQGLEIIRRDEEHSPDVDAVTKGFAIEHTSIDTIENQRLHSDWFSKAVGQLEQELSHKLRYQLNIFILYEGIQKGQDFSSIKEKLGLWILNDSATLPDGTQTINGLPGIPFEFRVTKDSSRRPGLFSSRTLPDATDLPTRLKNQLDRKAEKLAAYKKDGKTTILLVEFNDLALMNEHKMLEAIRTGLENRLPEGVDEIWYVNASIETDLEFYKFYLPK